MRRNFSLPARAAVLGGLLLSALPFASADAQWVLVARKALGRIHQMTEAQQNGGPSYDFATVMLDAPADRVFSTALEAARNNSSVRVLMQDAGARRLQIAAGDRKATLNVVPLNDDASQLMIAGQAGPGEGSTTSMVVEAVLRVCRQMNKHCEIAN
jgi:hypothetical protein